MTTNGGKSVMREVLIAAISVGVGMAGFWMVEGRHFITREDAERIVQTQAPYIQDRNMILTAIGLSQASDERLASSIDKNTQALTDLKVVLAELKVEIRRPGS